MSGEPSRTWLDLLAGRSTSDDTAVIGDGSSWTGRELVAAAVVAVTDADQLPGWDDLRAYLRERLAGFKVPTRWERVDSLPRNAAGKVLRRQLINERTLQEGPR